MEQTELEILVAAREALMASLEDGAKALVIVKAKIEKVEEVR